jgi:hypothetical protein
MLIHTGIRVCTPAWCTHTLPGWCTHTLPGWCTHTLPGWCTHTHCAYAKTHPLPRSPKLPLQPPPSLPSLPSLSSCAAPLDEALVHVVLDLSGRPHLSFDVDFPTERIGTYETQLVEHFFQSVVNTSGMTLHIRKVKRLAVCAPVGLLPGDNCDLSIKSPLLIASSCMNPSFIGGCPPSISLSPII